MIEVIVVAAVFATGMTLLARAIPDDLPMWFLLASGVVLVGASFGYVLRRRLGSLSEESVIEAFFIWDAARDQIVDVDGYEFGSDLARVVGYAMAEHRRLREEWAAEPLPAGDSGRPATSGQLASERIVQECVEYLLLEELSMHLIDFFERPAVDEGHLVELGREELADVVAGNRILDLFSTPLADRGKEEPRLEQGTILQLHFGEDYLYSRLDLHLPAGAMIRRVTDGIEVDSPVVNVRLLASFDGEPANLSRDFAELYLGDREGRLRSFAVRTAVRTHVKRRAMLLRSTWDYFAWVDDFRDHLEESWSGERFFERIGWPSVRALHRVIDGAASADDAVGPGAAPQAAPASSRPTR